MIHYKLEPSEGPDGVVTLTMDKPDFERVVWALGYGAGVAIRMGDIERYNALLKITNDLNRTNPFFEMTDFRATQL